MKFKLSKSSDWSFDKEIEFNTLEELILFIDSLDQKQVVIYRREKILYGDEDWCFEIYDDWRE